MTPDVEAFLVQIRARLETQAAFDADPQAGEQFLEGLEAGLRRLYACPDEPGALERYDRIRSVVAHPDWPLERLLKAILAVFEGGRAGQQ